MSKEEGELAASHVLLFLLWDGLGSFPAPAKREGGQGAYLASLRALELLLLGLHRRLLFCESFLASLILSCMLRT